MFRDMDHYRAGDGEVLMRTSLMRGERTFAHQWNNFVRVWIKHEPAQPVPNLPVCKECTQTVGMDGRYIRCYNFNLLNLAVTANSTDCTC
jgi:hypothetical protein